MNNPIVFAGNQRTRTRVFQGGCATAKPEAFEYLYLGNRLMARRGHEPV